MTFYGQNNTAIEAKACALMSAVFAMQCKQNPAIFAQHVAQQSASMNPAVFAQHVAQQSVRQNPAVFAQHVAQQAAGKLNIQQVRYF